LIPSDDRAKRRMKKVVIVQRTLKFYRVRFYNLLKEKCEQHGIQLVFIYGPDDTMTFNDADLDWGIKIKNHSINLFGRKLYYQPILQHSKNADLIIVEQASKLLINYYLWIQNLLGRKRLAFWGHGIDFSTNRSNGISEFVKKLMTKNVRWFFGYTDLSRKVLERGGFPAARITTVYNTIDVENFLQAKKEWNKERLIQVKSLLGVEGENICLFIGGMYKEKKLDFLLESAARVREVIQDFNIIFIGDGEEKGSVLKSAAENQWVHYLGRKNDLEKIPYFLMSKLLLVPGSVGLAVIDSFVFGVPLVTTNGESHGPEIDYLESSRNGIMTANNVADYSSAIIRLLRDEQYRSNLIDGCKQSAGKYTMGKMVDNFYGGLRNALGS
jgi:glycosyltransferase involved in cell wall biosynthesis